MLSASMRRRSDEHNGGATTEEDGHSPGLAPGPDTIWTSKTFSKDKTFTLAMGSALLPFLYQRASPVSLSQARDEYDSRVTTRALFQLPQLL
jgi:hypothetical protein